MLIRAKFPRLEKMTYPRSMVPHMQSPERDSSINAWESSTLSAVPLFRWAGGKQRFLWHYADELPMFSGTYHEPFAGGLSIYFHLVRRSPSPLVARIGDINLRLIRTYQELKFDWEVVDDRLRQLKAGYETARDKADFYYEIRRQHNEVAPAADAARFIFLMSTCWNGVFRVNARGEFNVPHGANKAGRTRFPTSDELRAAHEVFQYASFRARSWESALSEARPGDFVFLDPPYHHAEDRRDLYERGRHFSFEHQELLASEVAKLQNKGINFLLTNAGTSEMIDLYRSHGLRVREVEVQRSISVRASERQPSLELIVTPNEHLINEFRAATELGLRSAAKRSTGRIIEPIESGESDNE